MTDAHTIGHTSNMSLNTLGHDSETVNNQRVICFVITTIPEVGRDAYAE